MKAGDCIRIKDTAPVYEGCYMIKRIVNSNGFSNILVLDGMTTHKTPFNIREYVRRCEMIGIDPMTESGISMDHVIFDLKETRLLKLNTIRR